MFSFKSIIAIFIIGAPFVNAAIIFSSVDESTSQVVITTTSVLALVAGVVNKYGFSDYMLKNEGKFCE